MQQSYGRALSAGSGQGSLADLKKKTHFSVPVHTIHVNIEPSLSSRHNLRDFLDCQIIFQEKSPDYGPKALFPLVPQEGL